MLAPQLGWLLRGNTAVLGWLCRCIWELHQLARLGDHLAPTGAHLLVDTIQFDPACAASIRPCGWDHASPPCLCQSATAVPLPMLIRYLARLLGTVSHELWMMEVALRT